MKFYKQVLTALSLPCGLQKLRAFRCCRLNIYDLLEALASYLAAPTEPALDRMYDADGTVLKSMTISELTMTIQGRFPSDSPLHYHRGGTSPSLGAVSYIASKG